jgi:hypothetical protein
MTITHDDLVRQWGADNLVYLPTDRFARILRFNPMLFSPEAALPVDVPILFTVAFEGDAKLFDLIEFQLGEAQVIKLIVLGAVPGEPTLMFCLDATDGSVALVDLHQPSVEPVNSTMASFTEFLFGFAQLIDIDEGAGPQRNRRALDLRARLTLADPAAFADPESWWSIAFTQLLTRA